KGNEACGDRHRYLSRSYGAVVCIRTGRSLPLGQGHPCHSNHFLDGGNALSDSPVRLPCGCRKGIPTVRDIQGDGAEAPAWHHQSGNDAELGFWPVAGLEERVVFCRVAACEACGRHPDVGGSWLSVWRGAEICGG